MTAAEKEIYMIHAFCPACGKEEFGTPNDLKRDGWTEHHVEEGKLIGMCPICSMSDAEG